MKRYVVRLLHIIEGDENVSLLMIVAQKIPKILWKDVVDKIRGKEVSGIQQQSSMALLESITPVTWLAVACIVGVSLAFSRGAVVGVRSRLRHQYLRLRQHLAQQNSD